MKVLDIITETTPAPAALPEAEIVANWLKANPHLEVVEKYDPAAGNFFTKWLSKNKAANARVLEGLQVRYGPAFFFLKAIGIIEPLVQCIMRLQALNEQAKDGTHSLDWIKTQENAIVGVFLASQIAVVVVNSIKSGIFIGALRSLMTTTAMRTPGGARAVIIAQLATQAGLTALSMWISSDEGMKWCTSGIVMPILIGGMGAIGNKILEFIRDKIKEYTGKDIGIVTPDINKQKDQEKQTDTKGPSSDQIAKWEQEVRDKTNPISYPVR